jgi:beta-lactam-binding protein with PASTA domain
MSVDPRDNISQDEPVSERSKAVGWALTITFVLIFAGIAFVGLRSTERITVPNLVGMPQAEAVAKVSSIGLVPKVQTSENPGDAKPEAVVEQQPKPGVGLRPGGEVVLKVAPAAP